MVPHTERTVPGLHRSEAARSAQSIVNDRLDAALSRTPSRATLPHKPIEQHRVTRNGIPQSATQLKAAHQRHDALRLETQRRVAGSSGDSHRQLDGLKKAEFSAARLEAARHGSDVSRFHERFSGGHLDALTRTAIGNQYNLSRQYELYRQGDVARQLHLDRSIRDHGGWRARSNHGPISKSFIDIHFGHYYPGPSLYPSRCWFPHWATWVGWSWWDYCHPMYDPRPVFSRPILYDPGPRVTVFAAAMWSPLPVVVSGTWVDVPMPDAMPTDYDLQLLAVRFVDPGHPEQKLGPRYRVWFRNTSRQDIPTPFNVTILAGNDETPSESSLQAGVRVESIKAGQIQSVDLRLPYAAYEMGRDADGKPTPFTRLHVWVDSHGEVAEAFDENNGATIVPGDVLPVDPAAFSTDIETGVAGEMISIAGEGFGPEPGRVLVDVKGLQLNAEIVGWYDLGVYVRLPSLPLAGPTDMELIVVRGDGAASNPLSRPLVPTGTLLVPAPGP